MYVEYRDGNNCVCRCGARDVDIITKRTHSIIASLRHKAYSITVYSSEEAISDEIFNAITTLIFDEDDLRKGSLIDNLKELVPEEFV